MVRYSTGHALVGTLASWLGDTLAPLAGSDSCETLSPELKTDVKAASTTKRPCIVAQAHLQRTCLRAWHCMIAEQQSWRAMARSQDRAAFSPESKPPVPPSPAPVLRALGALLLATERPLVCGCLAAWKDYCYSVRHRRATLMWLMERMALSQAGLLLQAAFRSWCYVALQMSQPVRALDVRRELRTLLQEQATSRKPISKDENETKVAVSAFWTRLGGRRALPTFIIAMSLLGHLCLVLFWSESKSSNRRVERDSLWIDSDGDGIADRVDLCPMTPARHKFHSMWQTDWDGDGCLDSVEDEDDDNDSIINALDLCPRTLLSEGQVGQDGCTANQRRSSSYEEASFFGRYIGKLHDIVLEVVLGTLLTAGVNCAWRSRSIAAEFIAGKALTGSGTNH